MQDLNYKRLFSFPRMVEDLLRGFLPSTFEVNDPMAQGTPGFTHRSSTMTALRRFDEDFMSKGLSDSIRPPPRRRPP